MPFWATLSLVQTLRLLRRGISRANGRKGVAHLTVVCDVAEVKAGLWVTSSWAGDNLAQKSSLGGWKVSYFVLLRPRERLDTTIQSALELSFSAC
jgi:hypothetical protein